MFIGVACCECHGVIAKTVHIKVIRWVIGLHLPPPSPPAVVVGQLHSWFLVFVSLFQIYRFWYYRVSQRFVPVILCAITFDWIKTLLLLYRVHVFRISVTGMPPLFFMTFCSYCSMECDTAGHRWSILSFFITWCARQISTPKQYLFRIHMHLKKKYLFWAFIEKR